MDISAWLPMHFELRIDGQDTPLYCRIRQQSGNRIGLELISALPSTPVTSLADEWLAKRSGK